MRFLLLTGWLMLLSPVAALAQFKVWGKITQQQNGQPVSQAEVLLAGTTRIVKADAKGNFEFTDLQPGTYTFTAFAPDLKSETRQALVSNKDVELNFSLDAFSNTLKEVKVEGKRQDDFGIGRLGTVEGTAIYEAKKSEVVLLDKIAANLATNNSRQVFAKVAGLNIWESDGAGLQLGIGGRGLNPNRTSHFNTRQNGYDISADALGYPESYYTPPTESLERIEVVRGAASLQYGTQFGGMLNFVMKKGPEEKPFQLTSRQTVGSFGLFNSFNSVGGSKGKFRYYGFYQYKRGDGWRENSGFDVHTAFASVQYQRSEKLEIGFDYTFMDYLAQQPGGLTDADFERDPQQSKRERNWFKVNWNLLALTLDYKFTNRTRLNIRNFGLLAERDALGNLGKINRYDNPELNRTLLLDQFRNIGNETRLLHQYNFRDNISTLVVGMRYYRGFTDQQQGRGPAGGAADFRFISPEPDESQYDYLSQNLAFFAENVFNLSPQFSITPGLRYEHINTNADGYYYSRSIHPITGDTLLVQRLPEERQSSRDILLGGIGLSYKPKENLEVYGNFSQNYRAINFNDMRIVNSNIQVNPNLSDEKGSSADLGFRGNVQKLLNFDVTLFHLLYDNRIGLEPRKDTLQYTSYLYRTNIGRARHVGIESFVEVDLLQLIKRKQRASSLSVFANTTFVEANYEIDRQEFYHKKVELAPELMFKTGLTFARNTFKASFQYSYTSEQFTDVTNAERTSDAVAGIIPAYQIMDLSLSYGFKFLTLETGVNNLANSMYFTRRASGYPGPGIIPSDARNYYVTLQVRL